MKLFETIDRRLEQFLFVHYIPFESQYKNERGLTVWRYTPSPRLFCTVQEYQRLKARYEKRRIMHGFSH